jgi:hypothetical protein
VYGVGCECRVLPRRLATVLRTVTPSPNSPQAIVIRGNSFVLYGIYSGETRGTVEVLPPLNGFRTLVVKYDGGGADTMTVNVATGAARLAISGAYVGTFEGSCN